ncbi:hypothetical protein PT974_01953 [Cladobotryum mycophilum]|uniref:Uncharacterized protein n=1 Tax=Cladobotryum mycophilum TaxID=491253 RepID=A0ABR0SXW9_9HYPO
MGHVDPSQTPSKGKPWTAIAKLDFIHKIDLIIPQGVYEIVRQKVTQREAPAFYRVSMTLGQVLETQFLTEYIKKGNILMLSEGNTTSTNMFTLREGKLNMYLDRETFERAGLEGKTYGAKGNRGSKPRWKVSYDLRSPAMLHGKKGFDRLVYACKNALNQPLTWLLCNAAESTPSPDPLEKHAATKITSSFKMMDCTGIPQIPLQLPSEMLAEGDQEGLEEIATDIYEWLSLVRLESPRVTANDSIDPYLSRGSYPQPGSVTFLSM